MKSSKNKWLRGNLHNWNHAFAIVDFFKNGDFKVEVIEIINGKLFQGQQNGLNKVRDTVLKNKYMIIFQKRFSCI